jgi:hypothetical protein
MTLHRTTFVGLEEATVVKRRVAEDAIYGLKAVGI